MPTAMMDASSSRRSARKVKLTVTPTVANMTDGHSTQAPNVVVVRSAFEGQNDLPISEDRATSVLNRDKLLAGADGVHGVRYKSKARGTDEAGTPFEPHGDTHQVLSFSLSRGLFPRSTNMFL